MQCVAAIPSPCRSGARHPHRIIPWVTNRRPAPAKTTDLAPALDRDLALLRRWRAGDAEAGAELLDHYRALCWRLCSRAGVRAHDEVCDVYQDLVLRIASRLHELPERVTSSFAGFLAWQIRDLVQQRREKARRAGVELGVDPAGRPEASPDLADAIAHCADKLPPREREVFEHRYRQGLSLEEAAAAIGSNANAVAQAVFRLSRRMRDCLGRQGIDFGDPA
jgi:RNA polymerase sigma factor (sigma-70 family)